MENNPRKSMHQARKKRIFDAHDGLCWRCGLPFEDGEKIEYDHKVALCRGGSDEDENIGPMHVLCHKLKTNGTKALRLGADKFEAAKTKRIKKKSAAPLGSKHNWPSRPLNSRSTFGNPGLKKKLTGEVVRRDTS